LEEELPSEEEKTLQSERNTVEDQFRRIQASEEDTTSQIEENSAEDQRTITNTPGNPTFPTDQYMGAFNSRHEACIPPQVHTWLII
jgi:hypothetical protein